MIIYEHRILNRFFLHINHCLTLFNRLRNFVKIATYWYISKEFIYFINGFNVFLNYSIFK